MAFFAAHQKGACLCPQHQLSTSTEPGAATSVTFNSVGAQAVGDQRRCLGKGGGTDTVVGGAATVVINGRSAVPCWQAVTAHGGTIVLGSLNISIGGPIVIGPHARFAKACQNAAKGREGAQWVADNATKQVQKSNNYDFDPYKQGWGNCGPECARMLINEIGGQKLTEWQMLDWSLRNGLADWGSYQASRNEKVPPVVVPRGDPTPETRNMQLHTYDADGKGNVPPGGSNPSDWKAMTRAHGVETVDLTPNPADQPVNECIAGSLREGKPVIFSTHPGWLSGEKSAGFHIVLITGYEPGPDGNPIAFYVNDPANGCSIRVDAEHLKNEQRKGYGLVRPKDAAW